MCARNNELPRVVKGWLLCVVLICTNEKNEFVVVVCNQTGGFFLLDFLLHIDHSTKVSATKTVSMFEHKPPKDTSVFDKIAATNSADNNRNNNNNDYHSTTSLFGISSSTSSVSKKRVMNSLPS